MTTIALGVRRTKVRFARDLYQGRQTTAQRKPSSSTATVAFMAACSHRSLTVTYLEECENVVER